MIKLIEEKGSSKKMMQKRILQPIPIFRNSSCRKNKNQ